jgi:hypothetical protein
MNNMIERKIQLGGIKTDMIKTIIPKYATIFCS